MHIYLHVWYAIHINKIQRNVHQRTHTRTRNRPTTPMHRSARQGARVWSSGRHHKTTCTPRQRPANHPKKKMQTNYYIWIHKHLVKEYTKFYMCSALYIHFCLERQFLTIFLGTDTCTHELISSESVFEIECSGSYENGWRHHFIHIPTCTHVHTHMYIIIHTYGCMRIQIHMHLRLHPFLHLYSCVHMYCIHVFIYIYRNKGGAPPPAVFLSAQSYKYTYTYIYIYIYLRLCVYIYIPR